MPANLKFKLLQSCHSLKKPLQDARSSGRIRFRRNQPVVPYEPVSHRLIDERLVPRGRAILRARHPTTVCRPHILSFPETPSNARWSGFTGLVMISLPNMERPMKSSEKCSVIELRVSESDRWFSMNLVPGSPLADAWTDMTEAAKQTSQKHLFLLQYQPTSDLVPVAWHLAIG
jgi:hypothetical protein